MKSKTGKYALAVGIAGGIGSGKSEVCRIFTSLGASVLYADVIARELIDTHSAIKQRIKRAFGPEIYNQDGTLNRKQMAKLAFSDDTMKEKLNAIVHPAVLEFIEKKIQDFKRNPDSPMIIVEAALMYDSGADAMFDYIIAVEADPEIRIERVMKRDQASRPEIIQRMNAQMPAKETSEQADFTIHNSGDTTGLEANCKFLFNLLRTMSLTDISNGNAR